MSATLTWANSGLATKTGTAIGDMFADMLAMFNANAANGAFSWEVASSQVAANPYYIVLKRKDASVGRILIIAWTTAPGFSFLNPAILDTNPTTNRLFVSYHPAGNVDTPSNLASTTGAVLGDDTDCAGLASGPATGTAYGASFQPFYFDCYDGVFVGFQNPAAATQYLCGAGALVVDGADDAYPAAIGFINSLGGAFGGTATMIAWTTTAQSRGSNGGTWVRIGGVNRWMTQAFTASGPWGNAAPGSTNVLEDSGASKRWFVPMVLMGQNKGGGFAVKYRQFGYSAGASSAFKTFDLTGPVVAAIQFNAATSGGNGFPWFTNFKI
jgi:hypothetical protein